MSINEAILQEIKKNVGDKRYNHILRVAHMAEQLASILGVDKSKAERAAIFHDAAKVNHILTERWIEKYHYSLSTEEKQIPAILHGHIGAVLAEREYGEEDEDVLAAIRYHTTGRAGMSNLEKVIFVADYIEEGRNMPGIEQTRELVFQNFEMGFNQIIEKNLLYLIKTKQRIAMDTIAIWNERQEI